MSQQALWMVLNPTGVLTEGESPMLCSTRKSAVLRAQRYIVETYVKGVVKGLLASLEESVVSSPARDARLSARYEDEHLLILPCAAPADMIVIPRGERGPENGDTVDVEIEGHTFQLTYVVAYYDQTGWYASRGREDLPDYETGIYETQEEAIEEYCADHEIKADAGVANLVYRPQP